MLYFRSILTVLERRPFLAPGRSNRTRVQPSCHRLERLPQPNWAKCGAPRGLACADRSAQAAPVLYFHSLVHHLSGTVCGEKRGSQRGTVRRYAS